VALDGDGCEVGRRLEQETRLCIHWAVMGECEDAKDRVRSSTRDDQWQVAPEGRAARHAGQHVERRNRLADRPCDGVAGIPDGFGQARQGGVREPGRRDDPQSVGLIRGDDHRGFDLQQPGRNGKEDLEGRPEIVAAGERPGATDEDLASRVGCGALQLIWHGIASPNDAVLDVADLNHV
jgi:hypothetical protein